MKTVIALVLLSVCAVAQQTANEKAAWQGEENYWRYIKSGDKAAFMALWSDRFAGWPAPMRSTATKSDIEKTFAGRVGSEAQLTPLSVREYGPDIVIAFYRGTVTRDGKTTTSRFTHTWMRSGDKWQIIGGMSANEDGSVNK